MTGGGKGAGEREDRALDDRAAKVLIGALLALQVLALSGAVLRP